MMARKFNLKTIAKVLVFSFAFILFSRYTMFTSADCTDTPGSYIEHPDMQ